MIQITFEEKPELTCVKLAGELDIVATTNQVAELQQVLNIADKALEIDCSEPVELGLAAKETSTLLLELGIGLDLLGKRILVTTFG